MAKSQRPVVMDKFSSSDVTGWTCKHSGSNVRGVLRFSYKLAEFFWRFPSEFAMIRMRYRCRIVEVGNQPVQGRRDRQYGRLRHHSLGYLPSQFFDFRQVAEGTRNRAEMLLE
jgi:hypothetical protein